MLKPGYLADLIVLDRDTFAIPPAELHRCGCDDGGGRRGGVRAVELIQDTVRCIRKGQLYLLRFRRIPGPKVEAERIGWTFVHCE